MGVFKAVLLNEEAVMRAMKRISHEIIERNNGCENLCLVGIRRRGLPLAEILANNILAIEGKKPEVGALDITFYRDDLTRLADSPKVEPAKLDFDINGKIVILVDDVLYTGRTVRAALDALMEVGRPAGIQLVVLIDRGHRELPIRGDYIGKNVPTAKTEHIEVKLPPYEEGISVELYG